jgi:UDP-GlcNAc3NAcA epimerase
MSHSNKNIVTVVGARPQFIKAAMLSREIREKGGLTETILHTGQHYDANMSEVFFKDLNIPEPKYNLGINQAGHGAMTGAMLAGIEEVLLSERPDLVVVYGDTDSTLAGALAAAKLDIPVAHVEAGLRSFNRRMPEEINRILTDDLSAWLFTPTTTATEHLKTEGKALDTIHQVGDIMKDAAIYAAKLVDDGAIQPPIELEFTRYLLTTLHRADNTDDPRRLKTWLEELEAICQQTQVVLPLHPRTRKRIEAAGKTLRDYPSIRFIEPVGYLEMALLIRQSGGVITDSGGLQKEAYYHGVPCCILREETEWVELVQTGWSQLVPCEPGALQTACARATTLEKADDLDAYGQGDTASRIRETLLT